MVQGSQHPKVQGSQGPRYLNVIFKYELDSKEGPSCFALSLRFVNLLHTTEIDDENLWTIVKEIRKSFLIVRKGNIDCSSNQLVWDMKIEENVKSLEKRLGLNISDNHIEYISDKTLQTSLEMFTYLNYCPPQECLKK